jgi:hypothetical protein
MTPLSDSDYKTWLRDLGVSDAPVPRQGLSAALAFFDQRMPSLSPGDRLAFVKGMDLHGPVRELTLTSGTTVAAFRKASENPFKLFYTKAGTSVDRLGINTASRSFARFRVVQAVTVLESRCAAARDTWTDADHIVVAAGGGVQYIIPDSAQVLRVI